MTTERNAVRREGDSLSETGASVTEHEWVVAKSLLEVNSACTDTLEAFLLYASRDRLDEMPAEELADRLDDLIERQTRAIAELELARDAVVDLADE